MDHAMDHALNIIASQSQHLIAMLQGTSLNTVEIFDLLTHARETIIQQSKVMLVNPYDGSRRIVDISDDDNCLLKLLNCTHINSHVIKEWNTYNDKLCTLSIVWNADVISPYHQYVITFDVIGDDNCRFMLNPIDAFISEADFDRFMNLFNRYSELVYPDKTVSRNKKSRREADNIKFAMDTFEMSRKFPKVNDAESSNED